MATIRGPQSGKDKTRLLVVNPEDPITGEHSFRYYDQTRPLVGDEDRINAARKALRGLRGKRIRIWVRGEQIDPDTNETTRYLRDPATLTLHKYSDIFGSNGVLLEILKRQVEAKSDDVYIIQFIEIEELD